MIEPVEQEMKPMFESLPDSLREGLVRLLLVVLTIAVIALVRRLVLWLLAKPLRRLLERAGQPGIEAKIRRVLVQPVDYVLFAIGLNLSAHILALSPELTLFAVHLSRTLLIAAVALLNLRLIDLIIPSREQLKAITGMAVDEALLPFFRTSLKFIVVIFAGLIAMQEWGFDVSGLIAGLGIAGLAVSLAAQDTIANLIGFAAIVSDRPFVTGEAIKTPDVDGTVEKIGPRSTRVRQLDQSLVAVPNGRLAASAILNWSRLSQRKVEFTLGVTYDTRAEQMEDLLQRMRELLGSHETVDPTSIAVFFNGFGVSSLNILVRCQVRIADWSAFNAEQERILLGIMRLVEEMGLEIAFPTQSLYIERLPNGMSGLPAQTAQVDRG
jgi:MscS family membrane protein